MELWCSKCERMLDVEHFTKKTGELRGYQYACKACRSKEDKQRDWKNGGKKKPDSPRPGRGRPKGAKDKQPRACRKSLPRKSHQQITLEQAAPHIAAGELAADSAKKLSYLLRSIMKQQIQLLYAQHVNGAPVRTRMNNIFDDADFELKEALSRVNDRIRSLLRSAGTDQQTYNINNAFDRIEKHAAALTLLQVHSVDDTATIKKAYRHRAKELHPDAGGSVEQMQELNAALAIVLEERHE